MLKIKGVDFERRAQAKKQEVGKGLTFTQDAQDTEAERLQTVTAYLAAVRMYMLALAIWGAKPRESAPTEAETRETKPELYVHFPWQFSLDYANRAESFAMNALTELSAQQAFANLAEYLEVPEMRPVGILSWRRQKSRKLDRGFRGVFPPATVFWVRGRSEQAEELIFSGKGSHRSGVARAKILRSGSYGQASWGLVPPPPSPPWNPRARESRRVAGERRPPPAALPRVDSGVVSAPDSAALYIYILQIGVHGFRTTKRE